LKLVTQGKTYDLGLPYDRYSYKWPGHSPGEIISFRSPHGVRTQKDLPFTTARGRQRRDHPAGLGCQKVRGYPRCRVAFSIASWLSNANAMA
jgi:hypothetical protein